MFAAKIEISIMSQFLTAYKILYYFCGPTANAMSRLKDFPSIHDRIHTGYSNALHSLYEIGRNLSDKERQEVIARVRAKGYRVEELEFYEYAPTDTMRHLFVRMEGEAESIPYFMLDKECWSEIVDALLVVYTSPS